MQDDDEHDDVTLFRRAVRGTRRLHPAPRAPERTVRRARVRPARRDEEARLRIGSRQGPPAAPVGGGDRLSHRGPGVQEGTLRRLRRGRYLVQARIDLHGLTEAQALEALRAFLLTALERELRCVRIIHGKGARSGERGAVLKNAVNAWLRSCGAVLAFCSAGPGGGGAGATDVLLAGRPPAATRGRGLGA